MMATQKRSAQDRLVAMRRNRIMHCNCNNCGMQFEIDMGPAMTTPSAMDSLVESLARNVACDACAAEFVSREEAARRKEDADRLVQRGDVLPAFGRHVLDCSDPTMEMANRPAWATGREWLQSGMRRSLFIHGEGDSGKTHLARTLVIEAWRHGKTILEVRGWDLFNGSLLYHSEEVAAKTGRMRRASVLYVQGIDRGEPKSKHLGLLLEIMEERHARNLVTIMESQLEPIRVAQKWESLTGDPSIGGDIFSRLHPVVKLEMKRPRVDGQEVGMRQLESMRETRGEK